MEQTEYFYTSILFDSLNNLDSLRRQRPTQIIVSQAHTPAHTNGAHQAVSYQYCLFLIKEIVLPIPNPMVGGIRKIMVVSAAPTHNADNDQNRLMLASIVRKVGEAQYRASSALRYCHPPAPSTATMSSIKKYTPGLLVFPAAIELRRQGNGYVAIDSDVQVRSKLAARNSRLGTGIAHSRTARVSKISTYYR